MPVLLGSSKTVTTGGRGDPWLETQLVEGEIGETRQRLAEIATAVAATGSENEAAALFDATPSVLAEVRAMMAELPLAPTRPAVERYHGPQFVALREAGVGDPGTIIIVSGLFGPIPGDAPIPAYRLPPGGRLPEGERVSAFWGDDATDELAGLIRHADGPLVDLLPAEFSAEVDVAAACESSGVEHEPVRFTTPSGRSPGSVRLKQARGALAAYLSAGKTLSRFRSSPGMRWRHERDDAGRVLIGEAAET